MIRLLVKKQLTEIFRSYFYDAKKNKARSRASTIGFIVLFVLLMAGLLGGMFTWLSLSLCGDFAAMQLGWLYFDLLGGLGILLGAFGSVFNTYAGLYLAKDNDLLLSLPIPVRAMMASRLLGVYLMGLMYSAVVTLPAVIVYWAVASHSLAAILGGVIMILTVSVIVLILSCVLGWAVAKISLKLKHKSFVTVLASLVFIAAYYFFYFKASQMLQTLAANAMVYGEAIRGKAYAIYLFGRAWEGDPIAVLAVVAVTAILLALTWYVLSRSFLRIATASGSVGKVKYREKAVKMRAIPQAMFRKELSRFTASPNYMLNCGLGILLIPVGGVLLLIKGAWLRDFAVTELGWNVEFLTLIAAGALCVMASMVDISAPSVSLEGRNLWLVQSLPILPREALLAKLRLQICLTGVPLAFSGVCAILSLRPGISGAAILLLLPQAFSVLMAAFGLLMDLKRPNLHWTNEIAPIKQNLSVMVVLFGGWALSAALMVAGWLLRDLVSPGITAWLCLAVLAAASAALLRWLKTKGTRIFAAL